MALYLKNTKSDIIIIEEDEKDFKNNNIRRLFEKKINVINLEVTVT